MESIGKGASWEAFNVQILRTTVVEIVHSWLACLWIISQHQRHKRWFFQRLKVSCRHPTPLFCYPQYLHNGLQVNLKDVQSWSDNTCRPHKMRSHFIALQAGNPIKEARVTRTRAATQATVDWLPSVVDVAQAAHAQLLVSYKLPRGAKLSQQVSLTDHHARIACPILLSPLLKHSSDLVPNFFYGPTTQLYV